MIATLLAALLAQAFYTPEEADQLFAQGAAAYERAEYDRAIELWQRLSERGYAGPDVLYNLGTAALRQEDLAQAVLYLERARRAGGSAEDVIANLQVARARQGDEVVGAVQEPFVERLVYATPGKEVAWFFLGAWLSGFALIFLFRLLRPGGRAWVGAVASLLLLASIPAGLIVGAHAWVSATVRDGVVVAPTLKARELPAGVSRVAFEVHAGLKVRLLKSEGQYVQIRLPNGLVGWAEREGIVQI